jgi:hypothetical protein
MGNHYSLFGVDSHWRRKKFHNIDAGVVGRELEAHAAASLGDRGEGDVDHANPPSRRRSQETGQFNFLFGFPESLSSSFYR